MGNEATASKTLTQLLALRQSLVDKLAKPYIRNKVEKPHVDWLAEQIKHEIKLVSATMELLNSNVTKAFPTAALNADQLSEPEIVMWSSEATQSSPSNKTSMSRPEPKTSPEVEPVSTPTQEAAPQPNVSPEAEITPDVVPTPSPKTEESTQATEEVVSDPVSDQAVPEPVVEVDTTGKLEIVYDMKEASITDENNILNAQIPNSINGSKSAYLLTKFTKKFANGKTLKAVLIETDQRLQAIKDIVSECNG